MLPKLVTLSWLPLLAISWPCLAQDPPLDLRRDHGQRAGAPESTLGVVSPTPEMWFYEQERSRHDDPKSQIRNRALVRGQQRQDRLASMKWYGMSNSRPVVSITPWYGGYSAHWTSNSYDPLRWRASPAPLIVLRPDSAPY